MAYFSFSAVQFGTCVLATQFGVLCQASMTSIEGSGPELGLGIASEIGLGALSIGGGKVATGDGSGG